MQILGSHRLLKIALSVAFTISLICLFAPITDHININNARLVTAASLLISYILFTQFIIQQHRAAHFTQTSLEKISQNEILVIYASQTGYAEQLAMQTQRSLLQGEMQVRLCDINQLTTEVLQQAHRILFIISTTGEGDAPDCAAKFTRMVMGSKLQLTQLRYAILALGDRNYQAFCAFGHHLNHWLSDHGAQALFDLIEVDNGDDSALKNWQQHLGVLSGQTNLPNWHQSQFETWLLSERVLLNEGSQGNPVFQLRLTPPNANFIWQAGDIAEILVQHPDADKTHPQREYSIASLPQDGALELVIRQMRQADGSLGIGSGWLTQYAAIGSIIHLRLRNNRSFHPPENDRPLILIGNGTGIAGLRSHLKHRAIGQRKGTWLFFGERKRCNDFFFQTEIEHWQNMGIISHLHLAFSRDQERRIYVQDKLREQAEGLREWVKKGAAIYVCGSLEGMAGGVDLALREVLGGEVMSGLREDGLYRRDVY